MSHGRKKPRQPRWPANHLAHESTCHKVRTFSTEEAAELSCEARLAWHHLTHGGGTTDYFDRLANALNAALVLSEPIGQAAVDVVIHAQHAVIEIKQRYSRTGRFGATSSELADVPPALELYDQLLSFSNPLQLVNAAHESFDRIRRGDVLTPSTPI